MRHHVEHAEDAEVLRDSEIAGQGRVDSGEVGTAERLAAALGQVAAVDDDGSGGRLEDPQDHVDGGCLAGAVGAEEPEDFMSSDGEGKTVDGNDGAVLLAEMRDREDGSGHQRTG